MNKPVASTSIAGTPSEGSSPAIALLSLYVGYAMFMVLRTIPTVPSNLILDDPSLKIDEETWGKILAVGTMGAVLGKFIGGFAADFIGGRLTFFLGLVVTSIGVALFAVSRSIAMFQTAFFLALMAKSAGWPAMTKVVESTFRPSEYGRVWGFLATSSRVGTLIATFLLGMLLGTIAWRSILLGTAVAGILIAIAFVFVLKIPRSGEAANADEGKNEEDHQETSAAAAHPLFETNLWQALAYFFTSRRFWLIIGSLVGLTIMWDFLFMLPLYLKKVLGMSDSVAAMTSSAFPLGSFVSVLVGGFVFDKLKRKTTAWVMAGLLTAAAGCILTFYLMPGMNLSPNGRLVTTIAALFIFGLCVSPCYYIPMSVFSIQFGGPHSGFLVALLDALAFFVNAIFYWFAGGIAKQSWPQFLGVLLIVSFWSMVMTLLFMLGEARQVQPQVEVSV